MIVPVGAAVLRDGRGRMLLAQRPPGKHLAGSWEFPGGKLEAGESPASGLARELAEELGIRVTRSDPVLTLTHHYADRCVRLWLREVSAWEGLIEGREGQELVWVSLEDASALPMPAADRPMLKALALDARCLVLPDPGEFTDMESFARFCEARLQAGCRWIRLSAGSLSDSEIPALALRCGELTRRFRACWILDGEPEQAEAFGADGVHLNRDRLHGCRLRPLGPDRIVTAACRSENDLQTAGNLGLDLVTLALTDFDRSCPCSQSQGWTEFESLCADSPLPVLAEGGLGTDDLKRAREAGAYGVAVSSWAGAS